MLVTKHLIFTCRAYNIVETLQQLARRGRTVVCTIHQPQSSIFQLFDKVMLLCQGRMAYLGLTEDAVHYFNDLGYPCDIETK